MAKEPQPYERHRLPDRPNSPQIRQGLLGFQFFLEDYDILCRQTMKMLYNFAHLLNYSKGPNVVLTPARVVPTVAKTVCCIRVRN